MYSEKGSNERSREEATYLLFNEYLEEIEAGTMYKTEWQLIFYVFLFPSQ